MFLFKKMLFVSFVEKKNWKKKKHFRPSLNIRPDNFWWGTTCHVTRNFSATASSFLIGCIIFNMSWYRGFTPSWWGAWDFYGTPRCINNDVGEHIHEVNIPGRIRIWKCLLLCLLHRTDEPQKRRNSCLRLQPRSVLGSLGVVLMSCEVFT